MLIIHYLFYDAELVFNDHKRTVNRIQFHPVESNLLLSGSQDGTMKCFVSICQVVCKDINVKSVIFGLYTNIVHKTNILTYIMYGCTL